MAAPKSGLAEKLKIVDGTAFLMVFTASGELPGASWRPLGGPERPVGTTVRVNTSSLADKAVSLHDSWSEYRQFARQFERKRRSQGRREVAGLAEVKSGQVEESSK